MKLRFAISPQSRPSAIPAIRRFLAIVVWRAFMTGQIIFPTNSPRTNTLSGGNRPTTAATAECAHASILHVSLFKKEAAI